MEKILAKLSPKDQPSEIGLYPSKEILTRLSEQQAVLDRQKQFLMHNNTMPTRPSQLEAVASSSISPFISTTGSLQNSASANPCQGEAKAIDAAELLRLKQELLAANSKIALQEQELSQTRVIGHTLDQALDSPSEIDFSGHDVSEQTISNLQDAFNASAGAFSQFHDAWNGQEDSHSDVSDALSTGVYNRPRGFWTTPAQQAYGIGMDASASDGTFGEPISLHTGSIGSESNKFWTGSNVAPGLTAPGSISSQHIFPGPSSSATSLDGKVSSEQNRYLQGPGFGPRRSLSQANRGGSCFPAQCSPWGTIATGVSGSPVSKSSVNRPGNAYQPVGLYPVPPYNPRPIGTPLSPTATEFTSSNANAMPWAAAMVSQ